MVRAYLAPRRYTATEHHRTREESVRITHIAIQSQQSPSLIPATVCNAAHISTSFSACGDRCLVTLVLT